MPAHQHEAWTPDRVRELPNDGNRYELIAGELLVTPSPAMRHQRILARLIAVLQPYVTQRGVGEILTSPADLSLDPDSIVQPDLFVIPRDIAVEIRDWQDVSALLLAIEILSPSTARRDRGIKRDYFQRHGVPEYWIVDPDAELVERWRPSADAPEVMRSFLTWMPGGVTRELRIELAGIFAGA